ncbi:hypothetical protein BO86DRAFT_442622 [Aspergillus japonicus CBS 114.51]|uniref:Rhodopsin domain-containing protein n=1 Tax=Aspergillus japonicus CBS 114.51 TaxID=1448312 RepID=A0A8T8X857_ASPJA|nr:hypothetical protein BO86DRAFT_442622 [Aspergillus japonicus CBS 114.51]RAH84306.1 hypothetical protein BO86DRAFT_442622 [Aspergillus japonicus CBS 114.51]
MNLSSTEAASDDKGSTILIVLWPLTGLTTVVVTERMYIRAGLLHNLGVDDWLIVFSLLMGLVYCILTTINVGLGFGKHAWLLSAATVEHATFLNCFSFLFGIVSFTVPKLAVTAMLNRILNASHIQRVCLWTLSTLAAIVSGVCIVILFTMCDPPRALWQTSLVAEGKATCKNVWMLIDYAIFTGGWVALSGFVDLALAIYSSTVLMKLHMSLRKRLALCAALGLGSVATAMAIIKCTQLKGLADQEDYTYGTADLIIWTKLQSMESNIVIIASCIPTLQPFLELMLGNRTASSYNNSRNRYKRSNLPEYSHGSHSRRRWILLLTRWKARRISSLMRGEGRGRGVIRWGSFGGRMP